MRCSIKGCPGSYENQAITHTVRHQGDVIVIDHVPVEVCAVCGDTLLTPETVDRIDSILQSRGAPARTAPLYEYA